MTISCKKCAIAKQAEPLVLEVTDEMRTQVKTLAATGLPHRYIRTHIINPKTGKYITQDALRKHFADELDAGRELVSTRALRRIEDFADEGNVQAATLMFSHYVAKELDKELQLELADALKSAVSSEGHSLLQTLVEKFTVDKVKSNDY